MFPSKDRRETKLNWKIDTNQRTFYFRSKLLEGWKSWNGVHGDTDKCIQCGSSWEMSEYENEIVGWGLRSGKESKGKIFYWYRELKYFITKNTIFCLRETNNDGIWSDFQWLQVKKRVRKKFGSEVVVWIGLDETLEQSKHTEQTQNEGETQTQTTVASHQHGKIIFWRSCKIFSRSHWHMKYLSVLSGLITL